MKYLSPLILLTTLFMFSTPKAFAQLEVETGVNQGYEWNIFKNPQQLVESSDTLGQTQLWQNSIYNEAYIETDYRKEWSESRLKLSGDFGTNLYHQQRQANLYTYRFLASYRSNYADNKYIEFAPEFSRERQDGIDQTDLIFSTRLSYNQFEAPLHLDFYLGDKAWLKFETKYRYKVYDTFEEQQTKYSAYSGEGVYKKKWEDGQALNKELEFEGSVRYRDQKITEFATQNSPLENRERAFTKAELGTQFKLATPSESFEIEFPVTATLFYDHPTRVLDYREIEFGAEVEFDAGPARISAGLERALRDFKNFEVENGNTLAYGYWDGSLEVEIPITNQIYFNAEGQFTTRSSSRERLTTSFYRDYTTSYIQTGIVVELAN